MQRFRVVYRGISHESVAFSRYTHESLLYKMALLLLKLFFEKINETTARLAQLDKRRSAERETAG